MTYIFRTFIVICISVFILSGSLAAQDSYDWSNVKSNARGGKKVEGWFWTRPLNILFGEKSQKINDANPLEILETLETLEKEVHNKFRNRLGRELSPEELRYTSVSAISDYIVDKLVAKRESADKGNYETVHEHFFADDNSFNTGYREKEPAIFEEPKVGYTARTKGPFDVDIMKEAKERLAKPPTEWTAKNYRLVKHNCQHFADALRAEYQKIEEEIRMMKHTTTEYANLRRGAVSTVLSGGKKLDNTITQINAIEISKCSEEFRKSFGEYRTVWISGLQALQNRDINKLMQINKEKRAKAEALQETCKKYCEKYNIKLQEQFSELFLRYIREDCE